MLKVSIIVPVYNAENTLRRCVDSILSQSFSEFELILVDDGSKDGSGAICDGYASKDERIRVIHKENGGASSARNAGLDVISGEWVTFCDSDDFVRPFWLSSFVENTSGVEMVVQGMEVDSSGEDWLKGISFYDGQLSVQQALDNLIENTLLGYTYCKAFRKEIIARNGLRFNPRFVLREDNLFVLEYFKYVNNVRFTSSQGYFYYVPQWRVKYANDFKCANEFNLYIIEYELIRNNPKISTLSFSYTKTLHECVGYVFRAYANGNRQAYYCLKLLKNVVGDDFFKVKGVSFITRAAYRLPAPICHLLFSLKKIKQ